MEITVNLAQLLFSAAGLLLIMQMVFGLFLVNLLRRNSKELSETYRQLSTALARVEYLTSSGRETSLRHYDQILSELSSKLPQDISEQSSEILFELESKILSRLAELEPGLKTNQESKKKMDELISVMERLEKTMVNSASETAKKVLADSRRSLFSISRSVNLNP